MEEYKSNSNKSREKLDKQLPNEEPKITKVISGTAKTKKKNGVQKFADVFIAEDIANVKKIFIRQITIAAALEQSKFLVRLN